ncbi:MAG: hypothetical protein P4L84_01895 [Isosphaeraceae bacterium]|nr:hypothetical protein [Isosphaeraceae bacterium]
MALRCLVLVWAITGTEPGAAGPSRDAGAPKSQESARRVLELAARYEFFAGEDRRKRFEFQPKPLLTYTNPIRGEVFGNVFVWTWEGRPEVIGAVFDFRSENKLDSELHTMARGGVVGLRDGTEFWNPDRPGIDFRPVPGASAPASSSAGRLRQMRDLARDFTVERDHPEQGKGSMRLLPQPIYRYASPGADVVDGALFVFVEGTDPEAFLLIEAAGAGAPSWRFAFARMNIVTFQGAYKGATVWRAEPATWDAVFDKQEPYAIVREEPRRGLRRTR